MNASFFAANGRANGSLALDAAAAEDPIGSIAAKHIASAADTPLRADAFDLSEQDKMERIESHFREIMQIMGLDLTDDSLKGTPRRVAKMFVKEIFSGLNPQRKPKVSLFENKFGYRQMLVEKNIELTSFCEHHFLPIHGKAHVAYFANGKVIGLSKLNRIVDYFARRPQVQERLTIQITEELKQTLCTPDVAVYIEAKHMCVQARGIQHQDASTSTAEYGGKFLNENIRLEFLQAIKAG
jgi:GTP cyclohydrolase I